MTSGGKHASSFQLHVRAVLFYIGLGLTTLVFAPLALLLYPVPYPVRYQTVSQWATVCLWWLGITCRLNYRIEGLENVPTTPAIVLCKHQSAWETLALNLVFRPQVWVLKKELLKIPLFGWGLATLKPIAIDRRAGVRAADQMLSQGSDRLQSRIWVVIFPEGTRVAAGAHRPYRIGGARFAAQIEAPVIPVAHNAGDYWPRNSLVKLPGTIRLVIGPSIESSGRSAGEINRLVEEWIETTVSRLRQEAGHETAPAADKIVKDDHRRASGGEK